MCCSWTRHPSELSFAADEDYWLEIENMQNREVKFLRHQKKKKSTGANGRPPAVAEMLQLLLKVWFS